MTLPPDEPMTPEEQAMARRLRALRRHDGPSAELDAAILGAARAITPPSVRSTAARRTRWPAITGLAASCALALGLAWRLFPQHGPAIGPQAPAAAPAGAPVQAQAESTQAVPTSAPEAESLPAPTPPPPLPKPSPRPFSKAAPAPVVADSVRANDSESPQPAPIPMPAPPAPAAVPASAVNAVVLPPPVPAPVPPAPPAPPAPPRAAPQRAAVVMDAGAAMQKTDAAGRANEAASTVAPERVPVENGYDARPPATADDASVRDAWLQRIRTLLANGKREEARRSLAEYHARFPATPVPDDLRPLLPATPP